MSLDKIAERFTQVGIATTIDSNKIIIEHEGSKTTIEIGAEWMNEIRIYFRARQYTFHSDSRTLQANRSVEFGLRGLSRYYYGRSEYVFKSSRSDEVKIHQASKRWKLGFIMSEEFERYADASLKRRLARKSPKIRSLDRLLYSPLTALFKSRKQLNGDDFLEYARGRVESCLLKLAIDRDECYDFSKMPRREARASYDNDVEGTITMPSSNYNRSLGKFYKVAKSSQFPSQAFLSFYHILEYQFYRISDHNLYTKVRTHVNSTQFAGSDEDIRHILSVVYKHKRNQDETASERVNEYETLLFCI